MTEYFKIGKLVAAHGVNGEMILKHTLGKKTSLKGLKLLFIPEKNGSFFPWFIQSARLKSDDEVLLALESVITREAALKLIQKEAWMNEEDFKKFASKKSVATLLGYSVLNDGKPLGEILEVIEQPHQLLCRLEIGGKEVLIPLNEGTLQKIDHKTKQVKVSLPDGLLEIYLG